MTVAYPPAPCDAPPPPSKATTAALLAAARKIEHMTPRSEALASEGLPDASAIRKHADESESPWWAWAATVLEMAEAEAVRFASDALRERIGRGDTKAITFFLSRRAKDYADKKSVEVTSTTTHQHLHLVQHVDNLLTGGQVSVAEMARRVREQQALEGTVEDVGEAEHVEPHPSFRLQPKKQKVDR